MLDADGDESPRLLLATEFGEWNPMVSPDGRWLAYLSDRSGRAEIYVRPFPGPGTAVQAPTARLTPDHEAEEGVPVRSDPVWSSDSSELFYVAGRRLYSMTVSGEDDLAEISRPAEIFALEPNFSSRFAAVGSGDAVRFVMVEVSPADEVDHLEVVQGFAAELERRVPGDRQ